MYSYNSSHKIIVVLLVIAWAMYHFTAKSDEVERFDNGQIKRTGAQINSLNEGEWIWYFENGKTQIKGAFNNGRRVGIWEQFDSLGNIISSSHYKDNRLHGLYTKYALDGSITEQYIYTNDTMVKKVELQ